MDDPVSVSTGTVVVRATHAVDSTGADSGLNRAVIIAERPNVEKDPT